MWIPYMLIFFRDVVPLIEMIKTGKHAFRLENISKNFATAYDHKDLLKHTFTHENVAPLQALFFNLKRFPQREVRQAISMMLDFKWMNENMFYGQYKRTDSVFSNSTLAQKERPTGKELDLLNTYRSQLPREVFDTPYESVIWASANDRNIPAQAIEKLFICWMASTQRCDAKHNNKTTFRTDNFIELAIVR